METMRALSVSGLAKAYGNRQGTVVAVADLSLDIPAGLFVTLLGPSGSGKSTVLRLIAGFEAPDHPAGTVVIGGQDVTALPPHRRPTAMVFQRYALFPHLTVRENIAFGLRQRRLPGPDIRRRVDRMLDLVHLADRAEHRPHQLSGGQEQRVALARALVVEPALLLLDEPLAALDAGLRRQMQHELKAIQRQSGVTFLAVTHDQEEAMTLSDRMAIMHEGRILQEGTPEAIFERPRNRFVAAFMGAENILPVTLRERAAGRTTVDVGGRCLVLPAAGDGVPERPWLVLRPETLRLGAVAGPGWPGRIVDVIYKGNSRLVTVALDDAPSRSGPAGIVLKVAVPVGEPLPERVGVIVSPARAVLVPN